ncbi:alpha/beta hydrolase [Rhodococcus sp. NPDC058514]|uniref:alpha/beta hydrolase n=1 Tax=unclassified Rhodococcus (in: high G+C Gram-positive bacteria) TaxID=192944 RepID=UPI00365A9A04
MRPTVTQLRSWNPDCLNGSADRLARATAELDAQIDLVVRGVDGVLDTWHGDAARNAWDRAVDEQAAGNKVALALLETSSSMRQGAATIESAKSHAISVIDGAIGEGFAVSDDGAVTAPAAGAGLTLAAGGDAALAQQAIDARARELAGDIARALDEVALADSRTAATLTGCFADFDQARGEPVLGPRVQGIVAGRSDLPADARELNEFWTGLTADEKDALFAHDQEVGNRDGIPATDRDHYNRMHLEDLRTRAAASLAAVDARHPEWAKGEHVPTQPASGSPDEKAWKTWAEYSAWRGDREPLRAKVDEYDAVSRAANSGTPPPQFLLGIDGGGRAAVALGNPDLADNVATFVPGTGSQLGGIGGDVERSARMLHAATRADPLATTSVVTWYGYNAPQSIPEAGLDRFAEQGAPRLDRFQDGLRAAHEGQPAHQVIVGHSYGSTVIGTAAGGGGSLDVDALIFVGSPGVNAEHVSDLHLDGVNAGDVGKHVYSTAARWDPVPYLGDVTLAGRHVHGLDPTDPDFGGQVFASNPGEPGPLLGTNPGVHSEYWDRRNPSLAGMGRIIAGVGGPS